MANPNLLIGLKNSTATHSFTAADFHDFMDKKISDIRESTDDPVLTDTDAIRCFIST